MIQAPDRHPEQPLAQLLQTVRPFSRRESDESAIPNTEPITWSRWGAIADLHAPPQEKFSKNIRYL
jgi:hypothetical protein